MRVLLVNQYFWPDMAATAQLLTDLAEDLAASGCEVTALAGRGSYAPGREGRLPARERYRGVEIRRVWCTDFGRGSALGRVLDYATFMAAAGAFVLMGRWRRPRVGVDGEAGVVGEPLVCSRGGQATDDEGRRQAPPLRDTTQPDRERPVVVCLSTPPLVAVLGLVARLRGARFVYKVEDLYPDVAVALGTFREQSLAARAFQRLSRLLLRRADAVVALDEGMRESLLARGARRVEVIPNWADGRALAPDAAAGDRFRKEQGLEGRFVVLYSGNLGLAHRFDAVVEAARGLAEDPLWGSRSAAAHARSACPTEEQAARAESMPHAKFAGDVGQPLRGCARPEGVPHDHEEEAARAEGVSHRDEEEAARAEGVPHTETAGDARAPHQACGEPVVFLFVGGGPRLEEVRRACDGLPNVRFLPYQPRAALGALYNAADVHLVTLRDEVAGLLVPSKAAAALACGKPVLLVGGGGSALAEEIEREGVGWCCRHDAGEVAAVIAALARGAGSVAEAGSRARALFETGYDRTVATGRWRALLEEIGGAGPRGTARA